MKKNYTLKITLAMLVVVLVSLVSFVGAYKGKNLVKEYSLGKDLGERKIASYSVVKKDESSDGAEKTEEQTASESSENVQENNEEANKEEKNDEVSKDYNKSKDIIEKRLAAVDVEDFEVRLNEENGSIQLEVPSDVDENFLKNNAEYFFRNIIKPGKIEIVNKSTNETIVDASGFKSASAKIETNPSKYAKPTVVFNIKFTKNAKEILKNANTKTTDDGESESEAEFVIRLDGEDLYPNSSSSTTVTAAQFVEETKNGSLELTYGQSSDEATLKKQYEEAAIIVAKINAGTLPVEYNFESVNVVKSNISVKTIVIIAVVAFVLMFVYAMYKAQAKSVLPMLSLVGLVASVLLVLRYTNVKITLFTLLGLAVVVVANYMFILKSLENDKDFKENFANMFKKLIPCIIIAIVFCCSPYLQVSSLGMAIFWGVIVSFIYNVLITRVLINK